MKESKGNTKKSRLIIEIILVAVFLAVFIYILNEHAPKIIKILESGNVDEIDDYLMTYGTDGKLLLILLQVLETVSIVLPSIPVYICAGVLFGRIWGIIICYLVNLILTILIFLFAHKMSSYTKKYFDISRQKTIGPLVENAKHMDRVVIFMCLFPVVPGGMIPFLASQTNITLPDFIKAVAIGSLPAIAIYVLAGDFLMTENYKVKAVAVAVLVLLALILFIFRKKAIKWAEPKLKKFIEG